MTRALIIYGLLPPVLVFAAALALTLSGCIGAGMMANGFKKEPCPNNQPCERTK